MSEVRASPARPDETSLREYFECVLGAWPEAECLAERSFQTVGGTVAVRSSNQRLLSLLTRALAHLELETPSPPNLTIYLWDSASTRMKAPPSPLIWHTRRIGSHAGSEFDARGEAPAFNCGSVRTSFHVWPNMLHALDMKRNLGVCWIDDAANVPYYETAAPFRKILSWWIGGRDGLFVHGAAVGLDAGGVLLAGDAGSGKSTAALACLDGGLLYAGDDYCAVLTLPAPHVYSLYSTAKLKGRADLTRFPRLAPLVSNPERLEQEKALLFLHPGWQASLTSGFPLRAILIPRVTGTASARLVAASAETALRAMSPSTIRQLPGGGRIAFREMARLVRALPAYMLEVGPDVSEIPSVIRRLLGGQAA